MEFKDLNLLSIGDTVQMAGAVYVGDGKTYLCFFPDDAPENDWSAVGSSQHGVEVLHMNKDEWVEFVRQTDIVFIEAIEKSSDGKLAKAIIRKSARQVNTHVTWAVYRRDNYSCRYCGRNDQPLTVDHLILYSEGGPWTEDNLITSCKTCNKRRGDEPYADWLQGVYYKEVTTGKRKGMPGISSEVHATNVALVETLDKIKRCYNNPKKRG